MNPSWESGLINLINPNPNLSPRVSPSRAPFFLAAPISLTYKHLPHRLVKNLGPESVLLPWYLSICVIFWWLKMATTRSVLNSVSRKKIFGVGPGNDSHMKEAGILAFHPEHCRLLSLVPAGFSSRRIWQPFLLAHGCDDSILACNLEVRRDQLFLLARIPLTSWSLWKVHATSAETAVMKPSFQSGKTHCDCMSIIKEINNNLVLKSTMKIVFS